MKYLKTTKPVTCYLASGWFNEAQEQARQDILKVLEDNEISYFSPKDEVLLSFNSTSEERKAAFDADTQIIKHCDFLIASTVGKDMGTLMEMGMSYAWETPYIVYFLRSISHNFTAAALRTGRHGSRSRTMPERP
jgi:nucleoside 2-deoxyribosyltransferase